MSDRMQMLEDAIALIKKYTHLEGKDGWRPGLVDLWTYDYLIDMHESDSEDEPAEYVWKDTPDHIMQHMIDNNDVMDMEYGPQDLWEMLREYLIENDFIRSTDEEEEE